MAAIEIRAVTGADWIDLVYPLTSYAFRSSPAVATRAALEERAPFHDPKTTFVLLEDGRPMATAASWPMSQHVRGRIVPMGGVASVATDPLARRQGYARQVVQRLLTAINDQGQAVATLWPFRPSFYGRLGWASFPSETVAHFNPASLAPLMRAAIAGTITRRRLDGAAASEELLPFLRQLQAECHGLGLFEHARSAEHYKEEERWLVTARVADQPVAMLAYRLIHDTGRHELEATFFLYRTVQGRYLLLQWLAMHADHARQIKLPLPPGEMAELWLDDHDITPHTGYSLHGYYEAMGRVVNVEGLAGLQVGEAELRVQVVDGQCPWNENCFTLGADGGRLTVTRSSAPADCTLTIQGLSALVYSGHDPASFPYRGWGDPSPAVQAKLRRLFPPATPYLLSGF